MQDFVILISLDDGVCHALARRLRAEGVYCRIMPAGVSADEVLQSGARGVIRNQLTEEEMQKLHVLYEEVRYGKS